LLGAALAAGAAEGGIAITIVKNPTTYILRFG
jgi:hypothetical protein